MTETVSGQSFNLFRVKNDIATMPLSGIDLRVPEKPTRSE